MMNGTKLMTGMQMMNGTKMMAGTQMLTEAPLTHHIGSSSWPDLLVIGITMHFLKAIAPSP